jgi:hypothetical protein
MSTDIDDPHPDENEIKPFVAVGPSEDFSITVHKETFDTGFIIVTIIFILIIVTVLITCIFFSVKQVEIYTPQRLPTTTTSTSDATPFSKYAVNDLDGSAYKSITTCLKAPNTKWENEHCTCKAPYFGPTCSLQKHDDRFYAVGVPNEDRISVTILDEFISDGKSFNNLVGLGVSGSCSDHCLNNDQCVGFIYHEQGLCTLLTGDVIIPENDNIAYSPDINSTLYTKSSDTLKFEGRIFLSEFPQYFPNRYWLTKESYHYVQLFPREMGQLTFYPNYINVYGCYTGIYSLFPFTLNDVPAILEFTDSDKCYIHHPRTELIVPDHWRYHLPIYVMYLPA